MKINGTTKVAPVPPSSPTKLPKFSVNACEGCSPAFCKAKFKVVLPNNGASIAGLTTDGPCTPTNQNNGISNQIMAIPRYDSAPLNSGWNNLAITSANGTLIKKRAKKSIRAQPKTENEYAKISRKFAAIVPGTSFGMWIVISLMIQKRYTFTVKKAETNADKIPFVPMLAVTKEPSFCCVTASNKKPQIEAIITDTSLIALPAGILLRFIEPAKQRAVVPATNIPTTPIV